MLQNLDPVQRYYAERALKQIRRNLEQERLRKVKECVKLYSERLAKLEKESKK